MFNINFFLSYLQVFMFCEAQKHFKFLLFFSYFFLSTTWRLIAVRSKMSDHSSLE